MKGTNIKFIPCRKEIINDSDDMQESFRPISSPLRRISQEEYEITTA
jgi:hypothetical protein